MNIDYNVYLHFFRLRVAVTLFIVGTPIVYMGREDLLEDLFFRYDDTSLDKEPPGILEDVEGLDYIDDEIEGNQIWLYLIFLLTYFLVLTFYSVGVRSAGDSDEKRLC